MKQVKASGGVIVRRRGERVEVLAVHRPRYDDWSLPKGKLDVGESDEACALREVHEETGLVAILVSELDPVSYTDHRGRPKTVRYWLMSIKDESPMIEAESFIANDEVDQVIWAELAELQTLLSYRHDFTVATQGVDRFADPGQ
jgi:8-oxo-dGTP diphosphatase